MPQICIQIPPLDAVRTVELEVRVDGETRHVQYRVEAFAWGGSDLSVTARVRRLRSLIEAYPEDWELVGIGAPDDHVVPVMFRQRRREPAE